MTDKHIVASMTGFGKGVSTSDLYEVTTEIKSVNHRFKDLRFRMSGIFNSIELDLKKEIDRSFKRGSFDISISYRKEKASGLKADLDYVKINGFISEFQKATDQQKITTSINPIDFLKSEFYQDDENKEEALHLLVKSSFLEAVSKLEVSRKEEGAKMAIVLTDHKESYQKHFEKIVELKEDYERQVKEKLHNRFSEEKLSQYIDEPRFVQEVIFYLEKLDVDEEINRIKSHLTKLGELIQEKKKEIGREIDFVLQELNRETNTIGSKSGTEEISNNVIKMKVELEKMREQSLNIE